MNSRDIALNTIKNFKERLESAEILFKAKKYNDSVSRSYYAIFDAIKGMLEL